jgi:mRNA-degrading endonuclease toxin of MazEF toxin-antitoxin module
VVGRGEVWWEVRLGPEDGMPADCVLALDNLSLIRPSLCTERITRLAPAKLTHVCVALGHATGC